ncbi:UNVERIFIED_CONTAM: Transposon Tf2-12 polyprotein [Sesamum calycinum]|uniref:Transposon Tf2-12 polyprotein n=1 Tax=Sesamum calycinum TaxID=2727403 RepID=A0AAW2R025_9LAMI
MDGSSGYNQICMAPADEELIAFRTPKGIYCYKVMPFELKNADAIYQRAMQRIFDDMLHKNVECYVDDLVVKSNKRENHFHDLKKVFERLRRYQLKMNPSKCAFGVISGKFLGFIVQQRGIEIEQELSDYLPDEDVLIIKVTPPWKMYFDGASHKEGASAGVVFVTTEGEVLSYFFTLTQNCSNNVAEYQALILGLEIAIDAKQLPLKVYGDSQLVVN